MKRNVCCKILLVCIICMLFIFIEVNLKNEFKIEEEIFYENSNGNLTSSKIKILDTEPEIYFSISEEDRYIIEHIVAGEAGHESFLGKMAVAQCILNAMKQDNLNLKEVRIYYQYTGWSPENFESTFPEEWNDVCYAVTCVFDYGLKVTDENILWFYSPENMENNTSEFHENQKFVIEIGGHRFFAPK